MQVKRVCQLDAEGYFVGETIAYESPLEPGEFLIPAGAIDRSPPKTVEPGKRYRPWGFGWRGEDAPPQPEQAQGKPPQPTRADEIRSRLSVIDEASVRPARAIALALANGEPAPQADAERLALLEAEAQLLRAELASLG